MCGILFSCCLCQPCTLRTERNYNRICPDQAKTESLPFGSVTSSHTHAQHAKDSTSNAIDLDEICLTDQFIGRRGPDVSKTHWLEFKNAAKGLMRGCVLHLRGKPTPQPLIHNEGNALLWNGEIFDGIHVGQDENDTQILSSILSTCTSDEDILKALEQVHGPSSFIFWQSKTKTLWFGRDVYGRRSLLWHLPSSQSHSFVISSVAVGDMEYTEIPAVGIFSIDFSGMPFKNCENGKGDESEVLINITLHPWLNCRWPETRDLVTETDPYDLPAVLKYSQEHVSVSISSKQTLKSWITCMNTNVPEEERHYSFDNSVTDATSEEDLVKILETILRSNKDLEDLSVKLVSSLQEAVERRLNNLPTRHLTEMTAAGKEVENTVSNARVAILFSGGLDSSILAALADRCLPANEPIDLLNVAFEQPLPANVHSKQNHNPKSQKKSHMKSKVSKENVSKSQTALIKDTPEDILTSADDQDDPVMSDLLLSKEEKGKQVSLDHTLHTANSEASNTQMGTSCIPSNITCASPVSSLFDPFNVPDRKTGRLAYSELCHINPNRKWNFIEINVSHEELKSERKSRIRKLIYPLCTVLDDSIGCALWFAARGQGRLINNQEQIVVSKAKVILCGMAADEQFAGYSRHRAHFIKFGYEGLISQVQEEIWRISQRNLGRDDRIISDHGKEARFPFLDESFTKFVSDIPVHMRADLQLPRGIGEKLLLRISAFTLGLRITACQAKRAIQFGSKIAKLEKAKEKGSAVCDRLL